MKVLIFFCFLFLITLPSIHGGANCSTKIIKCVNESSCCEGLHCCHVNRDKTLSCSQICPDPHYCCDAGKCCHDHEAGLPCSIQMHACNFPGMFLLQCIITLCMHGLVRFLIKNLFK